MHIETKKKKKTQCGQEEKQTLRCDGEWHIRDMRRGKKNTNVEITHITFMKWRNSLYEEMEIEYN